MKAKIYVVEDDPVMAMGITDNLELDGYQTNTYSNARSGLKACREATPDLVILDLGLPDADGLTVVEQLRADGFDMPVLILTSRSSEIDILKGFRKGADDYVTKPFSPRVLLARISALLGRHRASLKKLYFGSLIVNLKEMATQGGSITTREYAVLNLLADHQGQPVSRMTLLEEIWGMTSNASERAVDTMILELRKKIEPDPGNPKYLLTQRGIGYKLAPETFYSPKA